MNKRQEVVLQILSRGDKSRDLYEGCDGYYWLTYSANEKYSPLTCSEAEELARIVSLKQKWPGCYVLAPNA